MAFLFLAGVTVAYWAEARGNPLLTAAGADQTATAMSPGGNMEGKEVRFGIANSALFATATTDASCGAINGWHDSFTPLGGLVPLANIQLERSGLRRRRRRHVRRAGLHHPVGLHRGPDGGPNPGVSRQEDPGVRGPDGDADRPHLLAPDSDVHGDFLGVARLRHLEHLQPGPARLVGDALRLLVGGGQQRVGVRRHQREHELVQHDARLDDAVRAVTS